MIGDNYSIKELDEKLYEKLCKKWPRRILLQSVFGSKKLIHDQLHCHFGQFISLKTRSDQFFVRAYSSEEISSNNCMYMHKELRIAISDETITEISHIKAAKLCKRLQVQCHNVSVDVKNLELSVTTSLKDCPVQAHTRFVVPHFGKSILTEIVHVESTIREDLCDDLSGLSIQNTSTPKRSQDEFFIVTEISEVKVLNSDGANGKKLPTSGGPAIGGVQEELKIIYKTVDSLNSLNKNYTGILLYGPSGTGKTLLAEVVMSQFKDFHQIKINGAEIYSQYAGETEERLRSLFQQTKNHEKSVVFLDEFDVLTLSTSEQERRVTASIKVLMDNLSEFSDRKVLLLATSSKSEMIDSSFRRPGRLDLEIELSIPNPIQREEIIRVYRDKFDLILSDEDIKIVSQNAHGYVGADLEALIAHATTNGQGDKNSCLAALNIVKPSAMREVQVTVPNVSWEDIGGLDDLKLKLCQAIEWPIKHPEKFRKMGIVPPKGVLMYGPPGCSKTMIAKALANESQLNFVAIKGPELFKKYVGESEQAVRQLFKRARRVAPCIVFFDEIDALGSERGSSGSGSKVGDRVLAQILTEMDGIEQLKDVIVVAATNRPDMIDKALMRPGRLDRIEYVPLPDEKTRLKIFQIHTKRKPLDSNIDLSELAQKTQNYSGAEIAAVCNEAALKALETNLQNSEENTKDDHELKVNSKHFQEALEVVKPRIEPNSNLLKIYDTFRRTKEI